MEYWSGISDIAKDGSVLKSPHYEYTIEKLLNSGASTVYKARRDDGKEIFLKQFTNPRRQQAGEFQDFIEFQHSILNTLLQLPSSIVEKNYEYFEYKDWHFHAKAFEQGSDLDTVIWEQRPDDDKRKNIIITSLGILKAIHNKGVVHSDLKPQQFFIVDDSSIAMGYRVKLIDFDHCMIPALNLSRPAGTVDWMSPEHVKQQNISFHSDVFTMGLIVFTLFTGGMHPYSISIENERYEQDILTKANYKSLYELSNGKFPKEISDIIDDMLEPNYAKRPTIAKAYTVIFDTLNKPAKATQIRLESNSKTRLIFETQTIGREIVKSTFGNHKEIYNKQFDIFKDNSGNWFIKGYDVPPQANDSSGNVYYFHKTLYNSNDVTNSFVALEDGGVIRVGSVEFVVRFV